MLRVSKCRNFVTSIFICYIIQREKWGLIFFFFLPCDINKNELNFILRFETCPNPNQLYTTSFHFSPFFFLYSFIFKQKKEVEVKKNNPLIPPEQFFFSFFFFLLCYFSHFLLLLLLFIIYFIFKTQHSFYTYFSSSILCLSFALKGFSFFKWIGWFFLGANI